MPKKEIDALFDGWDPDGSGKLELKEIEKQLRRGNDVKLDSKLQVALQQPCNSHVQCNPQP